MMEAAIFFAGIALLTLGLFKRGRKARRFGFDVVRKTLETGSIVRGIYLSGMREKAAELFAGKIPKIEDDPLLEYVQEAARVGRAALISSPEVNRYLKEIEELSTRMEGLDRALRFRGRIMSIILALILPVAVRVIPILATRSAGAIGPVGGLWMSSMVLLSTYFMTLDFTGAADYKFLGIPMVALSISNYIVSKTLEPLLLRVLISPVELIGG